MNSDLLSGVTVIAGWCAPPKARPAGSPPMVKAAPGGAVDNSVRYGAILQGALVAPAAGRSLSPTGSRCPAPHHNPITSVPQPQKSCAMMATGTPFI